MLILNKGQYNYICYTVFIEIFCELNDIKNCLENFQIIDKFRRKNIFFYKMKIIKGFNINNKIILDNWL